MPWFHWKNQWPPHRIRQFKFHWIIRVGCNAGTLSEIHAKTVQHWYQCGMICHRSSLIRQSCHFNRDLISCVIAAGEHSEHNSQFKHWEGSWHSSLKRLNCWRKNCAKFDSLLLKIQDATACSLEKVNFKVQTVVSYEPYWLF